MNKTFKVARSLTRGTVVTSEKASSYQGKAVKTVIAAAVASLVAGVAMAESTSLVYEGKDLVVKAGDDVAITQNASKVTANATISIEGGKATITNVNETPKTADGKQFAPSLNMTDGELVVKGANNFYNLSITGGKVTIDGGDAEANWRDGVNIGGYAYVDADGVRQTLVAGADTVVNVTNGMLWGGAQDAASNIRKASKLLITDGAKVNLAGSSVNKSGILYVGTEKVMELGNAANVSIADKKFGAILAPTLNITGGTINNAGTLNLAFSNGNGSNGHEKLEASLNSAQASAMAVTITAGGINTTKTGTTNIKANVVVDGGSITNEGSTAVGGSLSVTTGSASNSGKLTATTLSLGGADDASASLTNTGVLTAGSVTIGKNATLTTAISIPAKKEGEANTLSYAVYDTTVNKGGTLEITQLNSEAIDGIVIAGTQQAPTVKLTLNGGQVTHGGQVYQGNLKLGDADYAASVTFGNGDYRGLP
ncbi:hypothetical protein [uncultured Sutterella sp.]|uniref:hypothetical protein n=1 Tax=uncultured Sutterella sp. TaxID=286133 RepID=UPI0026294E64|nr:hypothetical protein [uncultured Sutterella sp.]